MIQKSDARDMCCSPKETPAGRPSSALRNPPEEAVHSCADKLIPNHEPQRRVRAPLAPYFIPSVLPGSSTIRRKDRGAGSLLAGIRLSGPCRRTYSSLKVLRRSFAVSRHANGMC